MEDQHAVAKLCLSRLAARTLKCCNLGVQKYGKGKNQQKHETYTGDI